MQITLAEYEKINRKWLHFLCAQVRLPDACKGSIPQNRDFVHKNFSPHSDTALFDWILQEKELNT
jgi:hypothetical protein